jgi:hypothetical protein
VSDLISLQSSKEIAMVSLAPNLKVVVNDDGAAILDIEHDCISTLNPTGAYVWQGLQRGDSVETTIANLARDTGGDPLLIAHDVRDFIEDLKRRQLLAR